MVHVSQGFRLLSTARLFFPFSPKFKKTKHENPNLSEAVDMFKQQQKNGVKQKKTLTFQPSNLEPKFLPKFLKEFHPINGHFFLEKNAGLLNFETCQMRAKRCQFEMNLRDIGIPKKSLNCWEVAHPKRSEVWKKHLEEENPPTENWLKRKSRCPLHICLLPSLEHLLPHLPKVMNFLRFQRWFQFDFSSKNAPKKYTRQESNEKTISGTFSGARKFSQDWMVGFIIPYNKPPAICPGCLEHWVAPVTSKWKKMEKSGPVDGVLSCDFQTSWGKGSWNLPWWLVGSEILHQLIW